MNKSIQASGKMPRAYELHIQPMNRIRRYCQDVGKLTPKWKGISQAAVQSAIDGDLPLEALGYYAYRRSHITGYHSWDSVERDTLGLSRHQLLRLRSLLREQGLLITVSAGTQTYSAILEQPLQPKHRAAAHAAYADAVKRQWLFAQQYRVDTFMEVTSAYVSKYMSAPTGHNVLAFEHVIRQAPSIIPQLRGIERFKAIGLWLILCTKHTSFNWRGPVFIAQYLDKDYRTISKLMQHAQKLGLVFYDPVHEAVGVSRFLLDRMSNHHPLLRDVQHLPWIHLVRNSAQ